LLIHVRSCWPVALAALLLGGASPAHAVEGAFTLEAPVAAPIESDRPWTRPGALPAAAIYMAAGDRLLGGLRLRSGILPNTAGSDDRAGFVSLAAAARVRPWLSDFVKRRTQGPWLELAGGVHLEGGHARPTAEAGLGWGFNVGAATLGPSLRYVEVREPAAGQARHIGLLGLEVGFSSRPPPAPRASVASRARGAAGPVTDRDKDGVNDLDDKCPLEPEDRDGFQDEDGCPDPDNDHDGIADVDDKCPNQPEVVNGVDDTDGCPDQGVIEMVDNRIVLDARVLFDQDRARVRTAARLHLAAIITLWQQHPEWEKMIIEGHTDLRGPDRYNDWLSTERASRVRKALMVMGVPGEKLEVKGMGRSHPLDPGTSEEANRRNRRVEFVIVGPPAPAHPTAATAP
jgi:outer membrane protein OmpA-like peptidoglycan-associated protein